MLSWKAVTWIDNTSPVGNDYEISMVDIERISHFRALP